MPFVFLGPSYSTVLLLSLSPNGNHFNEGYPSTLNSLARFAFVVASILANLTAKFFSIIFVAALLNAG
jgi:hypothetical protein